MTTLGSKSWGLSLLGRRIGRSIERCCVRVGGGVVTCGFFATFSVGLDHHLDFLVELLYCRKFIVTFNDGGVV